MLEKRRQVGGLLQHRRVEVRQQPVAVAPGIAVDVQQQGVLIEVLQWQLRTWGSRAADRQALALNPHVTAKAAAPWSVQHHKHPHSQGVHLMQ